ncbi:hypothetical protein C0J52_23901 [Blattella germanica]|nr:hypothetical protein C0J52_23901 [Blattella germanica]
MIRNKSVISLMLSMVLTHLISQGFAQLLKYHRTNNKMDQDSVFFPDQLEYLQTWSQTCESKEYIYWPVTNKCYKEFTQGPCSVGRILILDRQRIQPLCVNSD